MHLPRILIFFVLLLAFGQPSVYAQIQLPNIFGSNMVLPRDKVIPINGHANPNTKITLSIADQTHKTKSDVNGEWQIVLNPISAGGPYELIVKGTNTVILNNILAGDLWLCAGQSNMQFTTSGLHLSDEEIEPAAFNNLRLFTVDLDLDYLPKTDIKGGHWQLSTLETAKQFSATGYFFGQQLVQSQTVPIGLISSNLGATTIETWMSLGALQKFPQFDPVTDEIVKINKNFETLNEDLVEFRKAWDEEYYLIGPGFDQEWYAVDFDDTDWDTCVIPMFWEYLGFEDHDGSFWFRRTFDLDSDQLEKDVTLSLNQIDDYDIVWVNGQKVGEGFGNRNFRSYTIPKEILRSQDNTVAVRVFDIDGMGGMYTNAFWGNQILNGTWKYKVGRAIDKANFPTPIVPNGSLFSHPSILYNGNIAPLHQLPISGVIWYQGESNENRGSEYGQLLPTMIEDWRNKWNNPDLVFLIVQLANYRAEDVKAINSNWAEIRSAQMAASSMNNVDIVTAIDIGDANDIHPKNKKEVGRRLASMAMHYAYGAEYEQGPIYLTHYIEDNHLVVTFDTQEGKLNCLNKYGFLRGFALAGEDGNFHWANAFIKNDHQVVVQCPAVPKPLVVRYAWSDNPGPLDLVNEAGLPAFPFRTDKFKLNSDGKVFTFDPHGF